jgi:hypothetical protein
MYFAPNVHRNRWNGCRWRGWKMKRRYYRYSGGKRYGKG